MLSAQAGDAIWEEDLEIDLRSGGGGGTGGDPERGGRIANDLRVKPEGRRGFASGGLFGDGSPSQEGEGGEESEEQATACHDP
jgi:hypothetical protein